MRSGGSLSPIRTVLALLAVLCAGACAGAAGSSDSEGAEAVIVGTVFRDPGFALPQAEVTLAPDPHGAPAPTPKKIKKLRTFTSPRGEFVFHVPAVPMRYKLSAAANGYKAAEKAVTVQGEGRTDVTLTLTQESKK